MPWGSSQAGPPGPHTASTGRCAESPKARGHFLQMGRALPEEEANVCQPSPLPGGGGMAADFRGPQTLPWQAPTASRMRQVLWWTHAGPSIR